MNSVLKISASGPGEAAITVISKADLKGQNFNITFPQFPSIPVQKVIRQEQQGNDLVLFIEADRLCDLLEAGSPCQIKVPELDLVQTVIWPPIIGKRSVSRKVVENKKIDDVSSPGKEKKNLEIVNKINGQQEEPTVFLDQSGAEPDIETVVMDTENNRVNQNENKPDLPVINPEIQKKRPVFPQKKDLLNSENLHGESNKTRSKLPWIILGSGLGLLSLFSIGTGIYIKKHHVPNKNPSVKEKTIENKPVIKQSNDKKNNDDGKQSENSQKQSFPESTKSNSQNKAENLELMPLQDVLSKAPSTLAITKEGERRLENKQADDGILLLENAASKGESEAMVKLGLLYSPVNFKVDGPIPSPDMREAARYFQMAAQKGSREVVAPRQALYDWLSKKAETGDEMARLTLKDFWQ